MDCDVEEVPSTDSELTGSPDSASTCSSSSRSSTLSSISNTSWTPIAKKLQNGGRTPKSFVYSLLAAPVLSITITIVRLLPRLSTMAGYSR